MFNKTFKSAVATLAIGLMAAGCSDDDDDVISGLFTTDNFPGSAIAAGNTSDDARAWSNAGQSIVTFPQFFWSCQQRKAIAAYVSIDDNGSRAINYFAAFNGTAWGAPTQIQGATEDDGGFDQVGVLWIGANSLTNGSSRVGDALIVYTADDQDPFATSDTNEEANTRLWGSWYDSSAASSTPAGTWLNGFDTVSITVDTDNIVTGGPNTTTAPATQNDPDVGGFGFASDSLCCAHEWFGAGSEVVSGEATNSAHIIFNKSTSSGTTGVGNRLQAAAVDLTAADTGLGLADMLLTADVIDPVAESFENADEVFDEFVTYNTGVVWEAGDFSTATSGMGADDEDIVLTVSVFDDVDSSQASDDDDMGSGQTTDPDFAFLPSADDIYGNDEGLPNVTVFYIQAGRTDGTDGADAGESSLFVTQIELDAASLVVDTPLEIDAYDLTGAIDLDPDDTDDDDGAAGATGELAERPDGAGDVDDYWTVMNRTRDGIAIMISQPNSDARDSVAADNTGATEFNYILFANYFQPRQPGELSRTLDESISVSGAIPVPMIEASGQDASADPQEGWDDFAWQDELGWGEGCATPCGFQANVDRYNFAYTQREDLNQSATDDDNDDYNLVRNAITADNGDLETANSTASQPDHDLLLSSQTAGVILEMDGINQAAGIARGHDWIQVDGGYTDANASDYGADMIYLVAQEGTSATSESASNNFVEVRLYVSEDGATPTQISTDGADDEDQFAGEFEVVQTAHSSSTGALAPSRHTIVWSEVIGRSSSGRRLMSRTYNASQTLSTTVGFDDRFSPVLADDPVQIDNPTQGDLLESSGPIGFGPYNGLEWVRNGSTVGFFFDEDNHIFYNQTSGAAETGFSFDGNVGAPDLVDNDSGDPVEAWTVFLPPYCDDLSKTHVVYLRVDADQAPTIFRAHVRWLD